ncbi:hypothetical protein BAUCODRAFT_337426 [Baudoinia panamericana UAMH 10762]|uniref:Uncharacterized protein n=1 Tax=Baudoinia panamericana (strain UAMH 10762) TaxID=717646 RepID=M2N606_BAUPA|nr:uncharacterized protein BAUCODRAFT_337426 [Baudoinia panamericana UAMH 10762]EMC99458.1 hypothetical protein BAUCODRAFT_337426 [Baudoinia panamericana UAMH 10762]
MDELSTLTADSSVYGGASNNIYELVATCQRLRIRNRYPTGHIRDPPSQSQFPKPPKDFRIHPLALTCRSIKREFAQLYAELAIVSAPLEAHIYNFDFRALLPFLTVYSAFTYCKVGDLDRGAATGPRFPTITHHSPLRTLTTMLNTR